MLFAQPECVKVPTDLVRLWMHEASRVYRDKFVEQVDMEQYDKLLKDCVKKTFEVRIILAYHYYKSKSN